MAKVRAIARRRQDDGAETGRLLYALNASLGLLRSHTTVFCAHCGAKFERPQLREHVALWHPGAAGARAKRAAIEGPFPPEEAKQIAAAWPKTRDDTGVRLLRVLSALLPGGAVREVAQQVLVGGSYLADPSPQEIRAWQHAVSAGVDVPPPPPRIVDPPLCVATVYAGPRELEIARVLAWLNQRATAPRRGGDVQRVRTCERCARFYVELGTLRRAWRCEQCARAARRDAATRRQRRRRAAR